MAKVDLRQLQQLLMMQRAPMMPQPTVIKIDFSGLLGAFQQMQREQQNQPSGSLDAAARMPVRESISPRPG